ncbi:MAG: hypothetical protein K2O70_01110, partial [Desulfovibrionaceae bacterium]|nr:hypothetical protein [Desulfovibrionaceae bacterium]
EGEARTSIPCRGLGCDEHSGPFLFQKITASSFLGKSVEVGVQGNRTNEDTLLKTVAMPASAITIFLFQRVMRFI